MMEPENSPKRKTVERAAAPSFRHPAGRVGRPLALAQAAFSRLPAGCRKDGTAALFLSLSMLVVGAAEPEASKSEMPRIRHLEPGQAIESFQVRDGFQIKLAAAEPLVADPMAMAFDELSRLYVVEMHGYPEKRHEKIGKVRLLTDADNDGVFDFSRTFAENLGWPSAIICYDGGVFVGCAPDIYFMKDTDGDGVADLKRTVFTGFRTGSPREIAPRLFNSFRWGYDNRIYGASSMNGGIVRRPDQPESQAVNLTRHDFSFDPKTFDLRAESGTAQHGMSFDLRGNRYVSRNSNHLQAYLYDARYAGRNPHYTMPHWKQDIAAEGPAAKIFRISPPEPWRVLRTRWRVEGQISGPVEGGGTTFGYFTSATGVTIYRGDAFPDALVGNAFIGAPANNLIHRKTLTFAGAAPVARRADENREFIASTDNWFRPVQFANGPDGCLWVADMYRETIEVAHAIPESIKEHLDIYSGADRGRIYRIVPDGFRSRATPRFQSLNSLELAPYLEHANHWHRETAARLLFERNDRAAAPALTRLLNASASFPAKLHALYLLKGMGALPPVSIAAAFSDPFPAVREHALRLAQADLESEFILQDTIINLVDDPDARVRLQLAFTLGASKWDDSTQWLFMLARVPTNDRWINAAILNSIYPLRTNLLAYLVRPPIKIESPPSAAEQALMSGLIEQAVASRDAKMIPYALEALGPRVKVFDHYQMAAALGRGLRRAKASPEDIHAAELMGRLLRRAKADADDQSSSNQLSAIAFLAYHKFAEVAATLYPLLAPDRAPEIRLATLKTLDQFNSPGIAVEILKHWSSFTPAIRDEALRVLFRRPSHQQALLAAIEDGSIAAREIPFSRRNYLKRSRNATIKAAAARVFGASALAVRSEAIRAFSPALELTGNSTKGARHVRERCLTCHRFKNEGHALGPDLETIRAWTAEEVLIHILDPNRKVEPNQRAFTIETKDDESYSGLIESESDRSVSLRMPNGLRQEIERRNIRLMSGEGLSLMPEGLEENLSLQEMADLIAFLKN